MTFKIGIHYPNHSAIVTPLIEAFEAGLKRHDVTVESIKFPDHSECDLAVCWNHRNHRLFKQQKEAGKDYLCLERGFLGNRFDWTALCFNGLNGNADWSHCDNSNPDRFEKYHQPKLKPYKTDGEVALIIGQVPGDASILHVDMPGWYQKAIDEIKACYVSQVVFRPHPLCVERHIDTIPSGVDEVSNKTLAKDLDRALVCVTMNSNTGVESVFAGVPTLTFDTGAMAYNVTGHDLGTFPGTPDRIQWAYDLAYKQWDREELANGDAWDHVRKRYGLF